jgi:hypothetical protein
MQRLPRHPTFAATSVTDNPSSITANTAGYRCSATLSSRPQTTSEHSREAANDHVKDQPSAHTEEVGLSMIS